MALHCQETLKSILTSILYLSKVYKNIKIIWSQYPNSKNISNPHTQTHSHTHTQMHAQSRNIVETIKIRFEYIGKVYTKISGIFGIGLKKTFIRLCLLEYKLDLSICRKNALFLIEK